MIDIHMFTGGGSGFLGFGIIDWMDINDTIPSDPPFPLRDGDADWIYRYVVPIGQNYTGARLYKLHTPQTEKQMQSHAKRRLGQTKGILCVIESAASGEWNVMADVRFLIKE
jgi:hypothetical protein